MAIYHVDVQSVRRGAGRSATAMAAYVTGGRVNDERTGRVSDYTRRRGVERVGTVGWQGSCAELWNRAEMSESHPRAITGRTAIVALPAELDHGERIRCAEEISEQIGARWGVAVTFAVHAPDEDGDGRNHHAHILWSSRRVSAEGAFGRKTRELDDVRTSRGEITWLRRTVAETINHHLAVRGVERRLDSRSLRQRWLAGEISQDEAIPRHHLGPRASTLERRGIPTDRGDHNRHVERLRALARAAREMALAGETPAPPSHRIGEAGPRAVQGAGRGAPAAPTPDPGPGDVASPAEARSTAAAAAAAVILGRSSRSPSPSAPRPSPCPAATARSAAGDDAEGQRDRGRRAHVGRARRHLASWALLALDVVAGREPSPTAVPPGLPRRAYDEGVRLGRADPSAAADRAACERAAVRIGRSLTPDPPPPRSVVPPRATDMSIIRPRRFAY